MTFADLIEKFKRYPVPSISGAIIVVCLLTFYFRSDVVSDLEVRHEEVAREAMQVDLNLVAGNKLEEHLAEMRSRLAELGKRIIQPAELSNNMNYFYRLEAETGVNLGDLRQVASSTSAAKPAAGSSFRPVEYDAVVSGTFPKVIGFFDELENGEHFYRLSSFNLQRGREVDQSSVSLTVNLELLGWP